MSASTAETPIQQRDTKVCPSFEPALDVVGVKTERKIKKEAEKDAARLREATLRLDVPVDPGALANELGVQALVITMKDEHALGGLLMEPGEDPKIVLNRRDGYLRQRLTCALELGHYLRRSAETNEYERIDRRRPRSAETAGPDEVFAQEFANCLLMPRPDVEIFAELKMDDLQMALHLMVPREAMQMRLRDLGLPAPDLEAD
jgi:Zn-dependent peptidase ImmA (M78 family)